MSASGVDCEDEKKPIIQHRSPHITPKLSSQGIKKPREAFTMSANGIGGEDEKKPMVQHDSPHQGVQKPREAFTMSANGEGGEDEKKPMVQHGSPHITLKLMSQDGIVVSYRVRRSTQFHKLMAAYCERRSLDMRAVQFLIEGHRLHPYQTPETLKMGDGDEICIMLHTMGGGHSVR